MKITSTFLYKLYNNIFEDMETKRCGEEKCVEGGNIM